MSDPVIARRNALSDLDRVLRASAGDVAVFLVYDRPERAEERPGLPALFFAQRCVTDDLVEQMISAFREIGIYVELFAGEQPFLKALSSGRLDELNRNIGVVYNGIGWGIGRGGFIAGRKALIPLIADSYGLLCANANAYACAFTLHKYDCFTMLKNLGLVVPRTWQFRERTGWLAGNRPTSGTKVIAKSTYEAWSVGVTESSVFTVDEASDMRLAEICDDIGQAVTVQEFIAGAEIYVPVLSCPEPVVLPPLRVVLSKAPDDANAVVTINDNLSDTAVSYELFVAEQAILDKLEASALSVVEVLQLEGLSRIDFRIDDQGTPWVFDIAVSPGLDADGAAFASLSSLGMTHPEFIRLAVAAALATANANAS